MKNLKYLLDTIPTYDNEDRKSAYIDLLSAIEFRSEIAMKNFLATWVDMTDEELHNLSQQDRQYRLFIKEFSEVYHGQD
jgi:hypothetical protein